MPRYQYYCGDCEQEFLIRHSMGEKEILCPECSSDNLEKIMSQISYENSEKKPVVGKIVKESIEEARRTIKEDGKQAAREYKG